MKTILVVDDSIMVQNIIAKYLSAKTSCNILTAEDGEIALDQVKTNSPDLIILDIVLPRVNGIALLKMIRKMDAPVCDTPVILISGIMTDETFKKEGEALNALAYLEKPADQQAAGTFLEEMLELAQKALGEK
ncbi:MAG: response regulator [Gemmatimonadota bacterium]|nr:response regulator [Gemmatimonadota bacterium]